LQIGKKPAKTRGRRFDYGRRNKFWQPIFKMRGMNILVVDDSQLILTKITELLSDVHSITTLKTCGSYDQAVRYFETDKPSIALLDINLPGKSGIELLQYFKSKAPETTVIMFSNQSSDYYKKLCFSMGADHFLDKSKDFDHIPSILISLS
jgi:DNA-binding NarL/FixJ family response regulator